MSKSETKSTEPSKGQEGLVGTLLTTQATLVAWLIFLGFGSAVLASYYAHLHYLPELKWEESFAYLMALTVLGGGLVAVYVLLLYLPGWIWSEFLIFDSELQRGTLCYLGGSDGKKPEPCYWSVGEDLVLPFAVLMVAIHFAMYAGIGPLIAITIVGLPGLIWYSHCEFKHILKTKKSLITQASKRSLLLKYTTASGVAALANVVSLFVLYHLIDPNGHYWGLLVICTIAVVVSNLLVAVQFRDKPTRALLTGIISACTLLICGEIIPTGGLSQSEQILKKFGIGDKSLKVRLDVTPEGRHMLVESGLMIDNYVLKDGNSFTEDLDLLSRLGDEYLVEGTVMGTAGIGVARVALPKKMVKSWSRQEPDPADSMTVWQWISSLFPRMTTLQWIAFYTGAFFAILIWMLHSIIDRAKISRRSRREADPLGSFRSHSTRIVIGKNGEACRTGLWDAAAIEEIEEFFELWKIPRPERVDADQVTEEELRANLIVLGGPDTNAISRCLSAGIGATLKFGTGRFLGGTILDLEEQTIYHPRWVDHARDVIHDYVLIYRMKNPFNRKAQILLIAGHPGHGAWVGIRHLFSGSFLVSDKAKNLGSFELLLRSEVHLGVPQPSATHVDIRPLRAW
jgi:hypothetical protein